MKQVIGMLCLCLCGCLNACDLEDERDLCCGQAVMEYRYQSEGYDKFGEEIEYLRHFLFDGEGQFMEEIPAAPGLCRQELTRLDDGDYTMVTVGNAEEASDLKKPLAGSYLDDFLLNVTADETVNTDPLFYGICPFKRNHKEGKQHFVTELSNVHCRLKVTVKWQNLPPVLTKEKIYRIDMENCAQGYELNAKRGYQLTHKTFPYSTGWEHHYRRACGLENLQLHAEFISLRYTNEQLPTLTVRCRNEKNGEFEAITPALDLKKAFTAWGYKPSTVEKQNYKIIITVYLDSHVGMKLEVDTGVMDWIDGGAFG